MMLSLPVSHTIRIVAFAALFAGAVEARPLEVSGAARHDAGATTVKVAGTGFDDQIGRAHV